MNTLTCFKAYDNRGRIGLDQDVAHRVVRAVALHLRVKTIVIAYDPRSRSAECAAAVGRGVCDAEADVLAVGMAGTEETYCVVSEFGDCRGLA